MVGIFFLSMLGVSLAGWPITPKSPQPRSSRLMIRKFGFGFVVQLELGVEARHGRSCSSNRNILFPLQEVLICQIIGENLAKETHQIEEGTKTTDQAGNKFMKTLILATDEKKINLQCRFILKMVVIDSIWKIS